MDFKDVTKKEAAIILMIQSELDRNDTATIDKICKRLKEKEMFSSAFANRYAQELLHLKDGDSVERICISCDKVLNKSQFCLCGKCRKSLAQYAKGAASEISKEEVEAIKVKKKPQPKKPVSETKSRQSSPKKRKKNLTIPLAVACVALIAVISVLSIVLIRTKKSNVIPPATVEKGNSKEIQLINNFITYLKANDYSLLPGDVLDDGSVAYEITPSGDYLVLFHDSDGNLTGTALQMNDGADEDQVRQLTFMAFLIACVYDDMELKDAGDFLEQELVSGDMVARGNFAWNIAKIDDKVVLMGIDSRYAAAE